MRAPAFRLRLVPAALALATGLAACAAGGDGAPTEPPTTGTTPPPSTTPPTTTPPSTTPPTTTPPTTTPPTTTPPPTTPPTTPGPTAGVLTGTVVDGTGRPLAGVQVTAENTLFLSSYAYGTTDAQGRYRIDVGTLPATWHATAKLQHAYGGETYDFDLAPDNDDAFAGPDGAVRNFTWKLSGKRPNSSDLYYGARAFYYIDIWHWPDGTNFDDVEFTFTPTGPLVDGTAARPLTVRGPADSPPFKDLPLGTYSVSARIAPPGQPARPLVIRLKNATSYADAVTVAWPRNPLLRGVGMLELQVSAPDQ